MTSKSVNVYIVCFSPGLDPMVSERISVCGTESCLTQDSSSVEVLSVIRFNKDQSCSSLRTATRASSRISGGTGERRSPRDRGHHGRHGGTTPLRGTGGKSVLFKL